MILKAEDKRGKLWELTIGDHQHAFVTFEVGIYRGGHYHETDQFHHILQGEFEISIFDTKQNTERVVKREAGDCILIKAGDAHLFRALTPGLVAESRKGDYVAHDYEPYRKFVNNQ